MPLRQEVQNMKQHIVAPLYAVNPLDMTDRPVNVRHAKEGKLCWLVRQVKRIISVCRLSCNQVDRIDSNRCYSL